MFVCPKYTHIYWWHINTYKYFMADGRQLCESKIKRKPNSNPLRRCIARGQGPPAAQSVGLRTPLGQRATELYDAISLSHGGLPHAASPNVGLAGTPGAVRVEKSRVYVYFIHFILSYINFFYFLYNLSIYLTTAMFVRQYMQLGSPARNSHTLKGRNKSQLRFRVYCLFCRCMCSFCWWF